MDLRWLEYLNLMEYLIPRGNKKWLKNQIKMRLTPHMKRQSNIEICKNIRYKREKYRKNGYVIYKNGFKIYLEETNMEKKNVKNVLLKWIYKIKVQREWIWKMWLKSCESHGSLEASFLLPYEYTISQGRIGWCNVMFRKMLDEYKIRKK